MASTTNPSSPSSEKTEYFDAPIMHFSWSSSRDDTAEFQKASDNIPDDPVINQQPGRGLRLSRSYMPQEQGQQTQPLPDHPHIQPSAPSDPNINLDPISKECSRENKRSRTPSLHSLPAADGPANVASPTPPTGHSGGNIPDLSGSALSKKGSVLTTRTGRSVRTIGASSGATVAFSNGATLTGPNAEPQVDDIIHFRAVVAEQSLSKKQKDEVVKNEQKELKRFSKLLNTEAQVEKAALDAALCILSSLQALHKAALKRENKAQTAYTGALSEAKKAESKYLEQRARWEAREAEARAQNERVEAERGNVQEMEVRVAECAREVERLRLTKGVDERERKAKMVSLSGQ